MSADLAGFLSVAALLDGNAGRDWSPLNSPRPVSLLALCAGMPPRDLVREAELTKRARELAAQMREAAHG